MTNEPKFRHFFWDFDGTLFNSYPHMTEALICALSDVGIHTQWEEVLTHIKVNVVYAIKKYAVDEKQEKEIRSLFKLYDEKERQYPIRPYDGVSRILKEIKTRGGNNYLYTHRDRHSLIYLKQNQLKDDFVDFITGEDSFPPKPAPDAILYLLEKHQLSKEDSVMIGDRDIDIDAGLNAGIQGILFDPEHFYDHYSVLYRIRDMEQLQPFII